MPASTRRALRHLAPIIEYRLRQVDEYGRDWSDKPVSVLSRKLDHFTHVISLERYDFMAHGRSRR